MNRMQFSLAALVTLVVISALSFSLVRVYRQLEETRAQLQSLQKGLLADHLEVDMKLAAANHQIAVRELRAIEMANRLRQIQDDSKKMPQLFVAEITDVLTERLRDRDPAVRKWAVVAIGKMGTYARPVFPLVYEATKDEDEEVRKAAAEAVKKIEPE